MSQPDTFRLPPFPRRLLRAAAKVALFSNVFDLTIQAADEEEALFSSIDGAGTPSGKSLAYDPAKLVLCARIASCFPNREALMQVARRGQITRFLIAENEADAAQSLLPGIFRLWATDLNHPALEKVLVEIAATKGAKYRRAAQDVAPSVSDALGSGHSVVLLHDTFTAVPPEITAVSKYPKPIAAMSVEVLSEVLRLTHSCAPTSDALHSLPADHPRSVTALALHHAFGEATPDAVVAKLAAIETSHSAPDVPLERLENLHLNAQPTEALRRIARDAARFKINEIEWRDATSSVLLYGAPGNGKTLAARALAGSAGLPYHPLS